ncbi:FCS-Like Zinc finger 6-like [Bidens hawaiensis]|uniref:FCS-Like Zinc finger 6-like n=1 Tax=Bidens hawaiensis TaxID=980011 RepID=UPI004049F368
MILGKRTRPPIKRTTSMTEFTLDISHTATMVPSCNNINNSQSPSPLADGNNIIDHNFLAATVSPRNHRRNSADCMETPHFMTVCRLCNRRLITGKDIFMYRGDSAFCSLECRQEKMKEDEKKEKHSLIPKKPVSIDSEYSSNPSKVD